MYNIKEEGVTLSLSSALIGGFAPIRNQDRNQKVRKQQLCANVHPDSLMEPHLFPSLDDLGHLAPGFGLLLGQRHPGWLILGQGRGGLAPLGGGGLAGEPRSFGLFRDFC